MTTSTASTNASKCPAQQFLSMVRQRTRGILPATAPNRVAFMPTERVALRIPQPSADDRPIRLIVLYRIQRSRADQDADLVARLSSPATAANLDPSYPWVGDGADYCA